MKMRIFAAKKRARRKDEVNNDRVNPRFFQNLEGFLPVARIHDAIAAIAQRGTQVAQEVGIIIYNQNCRASRFHVGQGPQ